MKQLLTLLLITCAGLQANAQQFIEKGSIEYEVKTNIKKTIGNGMWADMLKDNMPQFKTAYYTLHFANNRSFFKFTRWTEGQKVPEFMRRGDEENSWYFDFNTNRFVMEKDVVGSKFNVSDSVPVLEWKLTNENREIAGFNCRKAVARIMDSVYVFAFYTDEIMIPAGPCSVNGLPGAILGLTIPRMYTSYIATKVTLQVNEDNIKAVEAKKPYTNATLKKTIKERIKEWVSEDDDEDGRMWMNQFMWGIFL